MKPFADVDSARLAVEEYSEAPEDFRLPISSEILDPMGITMAIILDAIIAKGWDPDGFEQCDGYRIYKYKAAD